MKRSFTLHGHLILRAFHRAMRRVAPDADEAEEITVLTPSSRTARGGKSRSCARRPYARQHAAPSSSMSSRRWTSRSIDPSAATTWRS